MIEIDNEHETFESRSDEFVGTFDPDTLPSEALVAMLASIRGCDPLDVGPLGESVDTDALNKLVSSTGDASLQIDFDIDGFSAQIGSDRSILLTRP